MGRVVVRELFSSSGAFSKSQAEILRSVIQKKIDAGEVVYKSSYNNAVKKQSAQ